MRDVKCSWVRMSPVSVCGRSSGIVGKILRFSRRHEAGSGGLTVRSVAEALALDTNVYIRAFRDPEYLARLKRFRVRVGMRVRFHAVVALELRAGVHDERQHAALEALLAPYASRERVIVPSFEA